MSDRDDELRALAADLAARDDVRDAWTAKSFTDNLLVVVLDAGADLPADVVDRLTEADLVGANRAFDVAARHDSYVGSVDGEDRYRFLDTRTRGEHRSYVVD